MSAIGGLSSSTNSASSIRGYGGLASGLDRDSLIESMTYGTTSKIQKLQQDKQKIEWRQEAMRGITDKLYNFSQSFISYTSPKNLLSSKLYQASTITTLGANSKYIGVTGNSSLASSMSIVGVKQMASNAQCNFDSEVSDQTLAGSQMENDLNVEKEFNNIAGTSLTIKYGKKYFNINLPENNKDYDYTSIAKVTEALNKAMSEVAIGDGKKLSDVLTAMDDGDKLSFFNTDTAGNKIELVGSTEGLLGNLGFVENADGSGIDVTASGIRAQNNIRLTETKSIADQIGGKKVAFSYNGKTEWIELASAEDLKRDTDGLKTLKEDLQKKLDKAFGAGRISVGLTAGVPNAAGNAMSSLSFKTTVPGTGDPDNRDPDNSSVLAITSGERGLFGTYGALTGISAGDSNRLNLDVSFMKSGLASVGTNSFPTGGKLQINGVDIEVTEDSTLREIMDKINSSEAGVRISYLSDADRFVITSTQDGASGKIEISDKDADGTSTGLKALLFGTNYTIAEGKDAIVAVKYAGSAEAVEVTRGSNSFNLNGLTITAKGVFGYTEVAGTMKLDPSSDPVTFDVAMNTEPAVTAIKEMVEAFNEIVKLVNDEVSTKPNRKYDPLTSEQEDEMSESQVKAWNEKAKAGLLFNDSDVRGLADGLRSMISSDAAAMKKLGISVSTSYSDNGKIVFDEETFKNALATDPDAVMDAFTRPIATNDRGETTDPGGLMVRMQTLMNKYASTTGATKGILIERAGSKYAPTSILTNSMQKQMDEIDDNIDNLLDRLKMEQDRYISQFTTLETLISQMNSQSSWLQSSFGA